MAKKEKLKVTVDDVRDTIIGLAKDAEAKGVKVPSFSTSASTAEQKPDHKEDGRTHINIYSMGKTALGRKLSPFSFGRFDHPEHGSFCSLEGFYYYISTGMKENGLRRLSGVAAKKLGKKLPRVENKDLDKMMREAVNYSWLASNIIDELIVEQTIENKCEILPFVHYYVYNDVEIVPKGNPWLVEEWEIIRKKSLAARGGTFVEHEGKTFVEFSSGVVE